MYGAPPETEKLLYDREYSSCDYKNNTWSRQIADFRIRNRVSKLRNPTSNMKICDLSNFYNHNWNIRNRNMISRSLSEHTASTDRFHKVHILQHIIFGYGCLRIVTGEEKGTQLIRSIIIAVSSNSR